MALFQSEPIYFAVCDGWRAASCRRPGRKHERELADELNSHLQFHIDDNLRAGMSPPEARRQAALALGGTDQTKERLRDQRRLPLVEQFLQDLRFAIRGLASSPGFACVAVLTLAVGIAANIVVFSMVNSLLLRPLDIVDPSSAVHVYSGGVQYALLRVRHLPGR